MQGTALGAGARGSQERRERGRSCSHHKVEEIQAWPRHTDTSLWQGPATHILFYRRSGSGSPTSFRVFSGEEVPDSLGAMWGERLHVWANSSFGERERKLSPSVGKGGKKLWGTEEQVVEREEREHTQK